MPTIDDLNAMRPLDPADPDFQVAIEAMKRALSHPMVKGAGTRYWLVDLSGNEAADIVAVVDLVSLGNIARGSDDWASYSEFLKIHPLTDRHAMTDVLEAVIRRVRALREVASAPAP